MKAKQVVNSVLDIHSKFVTLDDLRDEFRVNPLRLEERKVRKKNEGPDGPVEGNTSLITAAVFGNVALCEFLLSIGANLEAKNKV